MESIHNPLELSTHRLPNEYMPYLSPPTLTKSDQDALLSATSLHPRDHLIFSLALGTGLRLAEVVGLNVGDVFLNGTPRSRIHLRVTKGGRKGDVFLPDALLPKLKLFWNYKRRGGESLDAEALLFCNQSCVPILAAQSRLRSPLPFPCFAPHRHHQRVSLIP